MWKQWLMVVLVLAGCQEDFDPASLITGPRILAARAYPVGEPQVAWPEPGETMQLEWLVADPKAERQLYWAFGNCVAAPTLAGAQLCQSSALGLYTGVGQPAFEVELPQRQELGSADQILFAGAVCAGSELQLAAPTDPQLTGTTDIFSDFEEAVSCADASVTPLLASWQTQLQLGDEVNHHPEIDAIGIVVLDEQWPKHEPLLPTGSACAGTAANSGIPVVNRAEEQLPLAFAFDTSQREVYFAEDIDGDLEQRRETLQLSHYVTAGELERQFSIVEADAPDELILSVDWDLPAAEDVPTDGLVVTFYFVLRDRRGGVDWTSRQLCVL